jgi:hypothetical protein
MKVIREPLIVIIASILLAICLLGGFGVGYSSGHRQALDEATEDQFLHVGHEVETSAFVNYFDTFRFHLSSVAGWTLISVAVGLLYKRFREVAVLTSLLGAALVLIAGLIGLCAQTVEFWSDDFLWSSPLGRTARVIQHAEYLGIFLFGYGLLRFATSAISSRNIPLIGSR